MTLNYKTISAVAFLILALGLYTLFTTRPWNVGASVAVGNAYQATTTPAAADEANLCPQRQFAASSTTGVLGSINVTEAGGGSITIYDATTTNNSLRVSAATSSLVMAYIPPSATENSYHYDIEFKNGLLVDYTTTGTGVSSSTISFRCEN